ncbi:MAG: hypothetical protein H8D43_04410 [Chloroflexi bacterium]|nr:hypothetical protein [Chloroflexota bacterium]
MSNEDRSFGAIAHQHDKWEVKEIHAYTAAEARQMRTVFQFFVTTEDGDRVEDVPIKVMPMALPKGHIRHWEVPWGVTNKYGHAEFVHPGVAIRYAVFMGSADEFETIVWDRFPLIENLRTDVGNEEGEEAREYYRPAGTVGGWRAVNPPWRYRIEIEQRLCEDAPDKET